MPAGTGRQYNQSNHKNKVRLCESEQTRAPVRFLERLRTYLRQMRQEVKQTETIEDSMRQFHNSVNRCGSQYRLTLDTCPEPYSTCLIINYDDYHFHLTGTELHAYVYS